MSDTEIAQDFLGTTSMVGVRVGQHQIVQLCDTGQLQIADKIIFGIGRAGVDQTVFTILAQQHRITLPDIQHCDGGRRLGKQRGVRSVQRDPGGAV